MIKAIVIDDEEKSRETLVQLIDKYCTDISVSGQAADIARAYDLIHSLHPDVIFLDIEMPHGSGFDLLKKISRIDFEVIFVTAFDQYALHAIKMCALDYLMKPINIDELIIASEKAAEKLKHKASSERITHLMDNLLNVNKRNNKIALPSQNGLEFIDMSKIIRCEADGNYTNIITDDGKKLLTTRTLKEYETLLPESLFFRVHYSHIINMEQIKRYQKGEGGHVIMSDNSVVDIAKRKKKEFLDHFNIS